MMHSLRSVKNNNQNNLTIEKKFKTNNHLFIIYPSTGKRLLWSPRERMKTEEAQVSSIIDQ